MFLLNVFQHFYFLSKRHVLTFHILEVNIFYIYGVNPENPHKYAPQLTIAVLDLINQSKRNCGACRTAVRSSS